VPGSLSRSAFRRSALQAQAAVPWLAPTARSPDRAPDWPLCAGCRMTSPTWCESRWRTVQSFKNAAAMRPLLPGSSPTAVGKRCAAQICSASDPMMPCLILTHALTAVIAYVWQAGLFALSSSRWTTSACPADRLRPGGHRHAQGPLGIDDCASPCSCLPCSRRVCTPFIRLPRGEPHDAQMSTHTRERLARGGP